MSSSRIFIATIISLGILLSTGLSNSVQAKWFFFGKDKKEKSKEEPKSKMAATAGISGKAKDKREDLIQPSSEFGKQLSDKNSPLMQTGNVSLSRKAQKLDQDEDEDGMGVLGSTLTAPMSLLQPLKGTQKGLESLQEPIKELKQPLSNLEPPLKKLDSSIEGLNKPINTLTTPLTTLTETTGNLKEPINSVGSNISALSTPIGSLKTPLNDLRKPLTDLGKPVSELNTPIKGLSKPIKNLNEPLKDVASSLVMVKDEISGLKNEINGIETTIEKIIFYILLMVTILCVTAVTVLFGVYKFVNLRKQEQQQLKKETESEKVASK